VAWCVLLGLACSEGSVPEQTLDPAQEEVMDSTGPVIAMPEHPVVGAGHLGLITAAEKPEYRFSGEWDVEAAFCDETRALQLFVFDPSLAMALVAGIPDTGMTSGEYRVVSVREGIPSPRTARVALQTYLTERAYSLAGVEGIVEIDSVGDVVTGRLAVSVFESVFLDTVRLAAAFAELPVRRAEAEACRVLGDPADSAGIR